MLWTNRHICTSTCIDYHKLCEIHQIDYTIDPVQFNYVKINNEISLFIIILIVNTYVHNWNEMPKKGTVWPHDDLEMVVVGLVKYKY